tara:strand:+ start:135 stop:512 length:378 start_codon:yes stop_codon:yes gene_type:complete
MGLLELGRKDWRKHITDSSGAGVDLAFVSPDDLQTANIRGLAMAHHLSFDADGNPVNSKNTHITFAESDLVAAGYTVRNTKEIVALYQHKISYADSTGVVKNYVVTQAFPDETVGIITCILNNYE